MVSSSIYSKEHIVYVINCDNMFCLSILTAHYNVFEAS